MKKKNIVSRKAECQFLALLRAGLWGGKADMECFHGMPDWKGIMYLGRTQAVLPLIYDGMLTLPQEMRLQGPALMKLIAYVDRIEGLNRELDDASVEISSRLAAEGIRSVLLKGQGLAVLYRIPGHRQCGDIDLYVGEENYKKAIDIVREWPEIHNEMPESTKHIAFTFRNMEIELHRDAFELQDPRIALFYRNWEKHNLSQDGNRVNIKHDIRAGEVSDNDIASIIVPPIQFNAVYIFCHAFTHFIQRGLGLRQLCDLSILLDRNYAQIDREELAGILAKLKLDREWKIFICLLVNYLGLPENKAPLYNSGLIPLSRQLLKTILADGNFGHFNDLPDYSDNPKVIRKFLNLVNRHIIIARRLKFSLRQSCIYYLSMWKLGMKDLFK